MFSDSLDKDAEEWIKALRLNYFHLAIIRKLRVGETFWIAHFGGPGMTKEVLGHCEAYIKRVRGACTFNAVWTIEWGKPSRHHVVTSGDFKLLPFNRIVFKSDRDLETLGQKKHLGLFVVIHRTYTGMEKSTVLHQCTLVRQSIGIRCGEVL